MTSSSWKKLFCIIWDELFRHFELLIDAVTQILTKIYQFQNLTYFVTWWRHQWRHEYIFLYNRSHNDMIHMHREFKDDIFAPFLVIMKNVVISFIKEYRWPTLRPPCDVIDVVIIMKILFVTWFVTIFSYVRSNWSCIWYFKIFKMAAILSSRQTFLPEVIPEVEYTRKIAMNISNILSIWSML